MEIGCHLPTQGPLATRDAVMRFCREAEARGIASLWVSDHVVFPRSKSGDYPGGRFPHAPDTPYLEPVAVLAAAAGSLYGPRPGLMAEPEEMFTMAPLPRGIMSPSTSWLR